MLLSALVLLAAAVTPAGGFTDAARSLDGRAECVPFRWEDDGQGNPRAAMSVAVRVNGEPKRFQVDTGADTSILYGAASDTAGWSTPDARFFRPATLTIGATTLERPYTVILRDMAADGIDGTLGLPALVGRVTVIDYPGRRLCLFKDADLPRAVGAAAQFVAGALHDGKFFLPLQVGTTRWRDVMLDTGSSAMPLTIDRSRWLDATGRSSTVRPPKTIAGSSWGKPVSFAGAPAARPVSIGGTIELGRPLLFTQADAPDGFARYPFPADGILGNASLWDGMVVLILTGRTDFGYIAPRPTR